VDELDRILESEETLEPAAGFRDAVMDSVRRESGEPAPLSFPWRRFVAGLATCTVLFAVGVSLVDLQEIPRVPHWSSTEVEQLLGDPALTASVWAAASLLGSFIVGSVSFRFSQRRI
jgi:hypothetical protein